ncbi:MAG: MATE family efflux transporter [Bacteroidales bacterium]|nr:MATE family efflux transporter [Bacteroidales bacterium]
MERADRLGEEKIGKLLWSLSLPSILGMLAVTIYNVADTVFIGRSLGTLGIAGISVSLPLLMSISTFGQAIGLGGASIISRALGAKDKAKANLTLNNLITIIFIINLVVITLAYFNLHDLLKIFGANEEIIPYAVEYVSWALPGTFFLNFLFVLMNVIRAEGNAKFPMISQTVSAVLNLIIDPIFIFVFEWGMMGAALATTISQFVGFALSLWYYTFYKKSTLKLKFKTILSIPNKEITKETFALAAASFGRQIASSVMHIILNNALLYYSGSTAIAAFGIIFRLSMFVFMPLFGINQGFMPIAGYNYGAKNNNRVLQVMNKAIIWSTSFCIFSFLVFFFFSKPLISIFTTEPELIDIGTKAMRIFMMALPIIGFQIVGSGLFQALGKAKASLFLAVARQILFLIPFVILFPLKWGVAGIWYSFPASDFLAALVTFLMMISLVKKLKKTQKTLVIDKD